MFNKRIMPSVIDLLFNLVIGFGVLFILSFILVSDSASKEKDIENQNNILISMRWDVNCDVDLWLLLPDGRKVYYGNREESPAFLDIDLTRWQIHLNEYGQEQTLKNNEETISIRSVLSGEYAVNVHLFGIGGNVDLKDFEVEVLVQDVIRGTIIFKGKRTIGQQSIEQHFVRFTVEALETDGGYDIKNVYNDRPIFFVGDD